MTLTTLILILSLSVDWIETDSESVPQPNVVLIISDDAGWADFGFQGSKVIPTPNLDKLANRGVRFANAYAGSVCSPSRACLVTGMYNSRIGYETNIAHNDMIIGTSPTIGLSPNQLTMFNAMQKRGYATGVIGKWHLGLHRDNVQNGIMIRHGNQPVHMGVDEFHGLLGGSRSYWVGAQKAANEIRHQTLGSNGCIDDRSAEQENRGRYVTEVFGDWSVDFIKRHAANEKPFFMYTSFTAPHTPMEAREEDLKKIDDLGHGLKNKRRIYAAMTLSMDREIGRILDALDDPDRDGDSSDSIANDTLVVFINDNGGDCCDRDPNGCSNYPLRGGKGTSWEGGFRIPMVVAGAGVDNKVIGNTFEPMVHLIDVLPTILSVGTQNAPPLGEYDGVNLLPFINGDEIGPPHKFLYLRRGPNQQASIRMGNWKLYHSRPLGFKLFDLVSNPSEKTEYDQYEKQPEIVAELKQALTDFDVQMMRPQWKVPNESTRLRFRESVKSESSWSDPEVWSDEQFSTGPTTLTPWDGFSDMTLTFRPLRQGHYLSNNDMNRQSGMPFMVNTLRFRSREEPIVGRCSALLKGRPIVLTDSRNGQPASLQFDSMSPSDHEVSFEVAMQLQLYSDLTIVGDSSETYRLSGGFKELRSGINVAKKGQCEVTLSGQSQLTGKFEVFAGTVTLEHPLALGDASVVIHEGAKLISKVKLPNRTRESISGPGKIEFPEVQQ